jgi:hypothetical protein
VNDLAAETLATRARLVAQVETWSDAAGDLPLNSSPFAAEAAVLMTPPPPAGGEMPHVDFRRRASDRSPAVAETAPLGMSAGGVNKALVALALAALALLLTIVFLVTQK